jgi:NAD(P)H dehydrogenase (quinone)
MHMGMIVVTPGQSQPILANPSAPYGATAVVGAAGNQPPTDAEVSAAVALGERVARLASRLASANSAALINSSTTSRASRP